jgi:membrane-associated phospholipid phosphatase
MAARPLLKSSHAVSNTHPLWRVARRVGAALAAAAAVLLSPMPAQAWDSPRVEWRPEWPKFRAAEVAFTAGLTLQVAAAFFLFPEPQRNWEGGILFDDAARGALRLRTRSARTTADSASDIIYYGLAAYPLLVDAGVLAAGVHGAPDVAVQLVAMDLEAYAFTGAIVLSAEKIGRVRPEDRGCKKDPNYSNGCGDEADLKASFTSGHTAIAFTSAGLVCAHHQNLPLYGGGAPDIAACVTALTAASAAGILRVMSDNHYTTDVLLGMGIGLFGGYGLPTLLHYGAGKRSAGAEPRSLLPSFRSRDGAFAAVIAPAVGPSLTGVTVAGTF